MLTINKIWLRFLKYSFVIAICLFFLFLAIIFITKSGNPFLLLINIGILFFSVVFPITIILFVIEYMVEKKDISEVDNKENISAKTEFAGNSVQIEKIKIILSIAIVSVVFIRLLYFFASNSAHIMIVNQVMLYVLMFLEPILKWTCLVIIFAFILNLKKIQASRRDFWFIFLGIVIFIMLCLI